MIIVNIHKARTHLSHLLEQVTTSKVIIIAKADNPIARIVSISEPPSRKLGIAQGKVTDAFFEPLTEDELASREQ